MEQELGFTTAARNNYTFLINKENHLKSMINLYLLELKEEKNSDALIIINKILNKNSSLINVLVDKAFVYYKLNKIKESLDICTSLLKQSEDNFKVLNILGLCHFAKKNYIEAEKFLQKAVELLPLDPIINDHYGDNLWMLNKNIQARYFWRHVLRMEETEEKLKKIINKKLIFGISKK